MCCAVWNTNTCFEDEPFENMLVERLKEYIINNFWFSQCKLNSGENDGELDVGFANGEDANNYVKDVDEEKLQELLESEIEAFNQALRVGIVHLIGENEVVVGKGAGIGKRFLIDYAFNFLKKNLRQTENVFDIPHKRMLKVGMTYEL